MDSAVPPQLLPLQELNVRLSDAILNDLGADLPGGLSSDAVASFVSLCSLLVCSLGVCQHREHRRQQLLPAQSLQSLRSAQGLPAQPYAELGAAIEATTRQLGYLQTGAHAGALSSHDTRLLGKLHSEAVAFEASRNASLTAAARSGAVGMMAPLEGPCSQRLRALGLQRHHSPPTGAATFAAEPEHADSPTVPALLLQALLLASQLAGSRASAPALDGGARAAHCLALLRSALEALQALAAAGGSLLRSHTRAALAAKGALPATLAALRALAALGASSASPGAPLPPALQQALCAAACAGVACLGVLCLGSAARCAAALQLGALPALADLHKSIAAGDRRLGRAVACTLATLGLRGGSALQGQHLCGGGGGGGGGPGEGSSSCAGVAGRCCPALARFVRDLREEEGLNPDTLGLFGGRMLGQVLAELQAAVCGVEEQGGREGGAEAERQLQGGGAASPQAGGAALPLPVPHSPAHHSAGGSARSSPEQPAIGAQSSHASAAAAAADAAAISAAAAAAAEAAAPQPKSAAELTREARSACRELRLSPSVPLQRILDALQLADSLERSQRAPPPAWKDELVASACAAIQAAAARAEGRGAPSSAGSSTSTSSSCCCSCLAVRRSQQPAAATAASLPPASWWAALPLEEGQGTFKRLVGLLTSVCLHTRESLALFHHADTAASYTPAHLDSHYAMFSEVLAALLALLRQAAPPGPLKQPHHPSWAHVWVEEDRRTTHAHGKRIPRLLALLASVHCVHAGSAGSAWGRWLPCRRGGGAGAGADRSVLAALQELLGLYVQGHSFSALAAADLQAALGLFRQAEQERGAVGGGREHDMVEALLGGAGGAEGGSGRGSGSDSSGSVQPSAVPALAASLQQLPPKPAPQPVLAAAGEGAAPAALPLSCCAYFLACGCCCFSRSGRRGQGLLCMPLCYTSLLLLVAALAFLSL